MTAEQARNLLPLTIVMWNNNPNNLGTVTKIGLKGVYIVWQDGNHGWIDFKDMQNINVR